MIWLAKNLILLLLNQLGEILFDHLGLHSDSKKKKTASGQMATGVDILEDLALEGHAIADLILAWRQLQKLKSTYTDALLSHINPQTGRIHGSFNLTGAATGRFSSSDPNLQNIPIRTPEGRLIRKAFIASPHYKIVSADYSQIELRLLAHIADIPLLKQAFADGNDIHTRTASEILMFLMRLWILLYGDVPKRLILELSMVFLPLAWHDN